jgi:transposase-like protein
MDRDWLARRLDEGASYEEIAREADVTPATIRAWVSDAGLTAVRRHRAPTLQREERECTTHGIVEFVERSDGAGWRCTRCRSQAVAARRRRVKEILIAEAGGACVLCGYDRHPAILQFHHRDPSQKRFAIGARGVARSLARAREEAAKCVLLCANCHAEVERGLADLPVG